MKRLSSSDWFFALVLWAVAIIAALSGLFSDRLITPLMGTLSCLVAAAILVNMIRFGYACAGLRRRCGGASRRNAHASRE
jgi:hypothetical protein